MSQRLDVQQEAWDFESRQAFVRFAEGTFVKWTRMIPVEHRGAFISDVLDRYDAKGTVFQFYQMEVVLHRA